MSALRGAQVAPTRLVHPGEASRPPQQKRGALPVQPAAAGGIVRQDLRPPGPRSGVVPGNLQVRQFMHHHVVDDRRRAHDEAPVELEGAVRVAFAPAPLPLLERHRPWVKTHMRPPNGSPAPEAAVRPAPGTRLTKRDQRSAPSGSGTRDLCPFRDTAPVASPSRRRAGKAAPRK